MQRLLPSMSSSLESSLVCIDVVSLATFLLFAFCWVSIWSLKRAFTALTSSSCKYLFSNKSICFLSWLRFELLLNDEIFSFWEFMENPVEHSFWDPFWRVEAFEEDGLLLNFDWDRFKYDELLLMKSESIEVASAGLIWVFPSDGKLCFFFNLQIITQYCMPNQYHSC